MGSKGYEKWKKDRSKVGIPENESRQDEFKMRTEENAEYAEKDDPVIQAPYVPDQSIAHKEPPVESPIKETLRQRKKI